jgi:hypothetical protein
VPQGKGMDVVRFMCFDESLNIRLQQLGVEAGSFPPNRQGFSRA